MNIDNREYIARFLTSEGWFNEGQVKGESFRPRKDCGALKTSVTRHDGKDITVMEKRSNAWKLIKRKNPIKLFGWANVVVGAVRTISAIPALDVEAAGNERDPNHANIIGWNLEEGQYMIQAEEIARQSKIFLLTD